MPPRPLDLRIDDLATPRLPPELVASRPAVEEAAKALVFRVDALCEQAAQEPFTPAVEAAMHDFMREHPRGKHGRVLYDLADFRLDRAERRRALQFYVERFGVAVEEGGG